MHPGAGPFELFAPPIRLSERHRSDFLRLFCDAANARVDTAENVLAVLTDLAAAAEPNAELTTRSPWSAALTPRERSYAITRAQWDASGMRRAVLARLPISGVEVLSIEHREVMSSCGPQLDLFSLHATGSGWSQPIGWKAAALPPPDRDGAIQEHTQSEAACMLGLIDDLREDLAAMTAMSSWPLPPLVSCFWGAGENASLRDEIGRHVPEYILEVGPTFQVEADRHPYEEIGPSAVLRELVAPGTLPRQLMTARSGRRGAEYVVASGKPGALESDACYFIGRPQIADVGAALLGRRPLQRVAHLAELAVAVGDSGAADRLGLVYVGGALARGVERVAIAMSAMQSVVEARSSVSGTRLVSRARSR